ncbi:CRISPR-associated endonuclease Cas6 [Marichromatium sp. AB32]|uniref:CRISPR-associated endonuclease Cas6 n=1 Tax=Marichromatium sp. AB32 TaxID=2483363 RepID=UPI000F3F1413|nr:CRISPR-associated endonuclease Cas6 [Marichromatium sp. AB32]RNE93019.1 hypothetical protein EBL85_09215 [Marichromatium sp. AB32]
MHLLAEIPQARIGLRWDRELSGEAEPRIRQLRGALGNAFREDALFHQHDPATGRPLFRYPRVQYRWHAGQGLVVGWAEAAQRLLDLPWLDLRLRLGDEPVQVTDATVRAGTGTFGVATRLLRYRFDTPVLLFNQENYRRYRQLDAPAQRRECERLLTASLLVTLRGLGVTFPERLYVTFIAHRRRTCHYKGERLLGLVGEFATNAVLPDGMACGHAVSHGYGCLVASE